MTEKERTYPTLQQMLRRPDVERVTGLSRSSIYLRIANGSFPKPISLGGRAVGWLESEIRSWLDEQISKSRCESE